MEIHTDSLEEYIRAELGRQQHSISWLAREIGMSRKSLAERVTGVRDFHLDEVGSVARVLGADPAALSALYFRHPVVQAA